ncbi:MAG: helix-turn-helix domain-containing protein [Bryobacteraceae bacterium]
MLERAPAASRRTLDLSGWRHKRGLSLEQIAEATKISLAYLRAIEEGRFERLPGGIYDLNYLRQYARAIQFDEEELLAHYRAVTGQMPLAPRSAAADNRGRFRSPASLLRGII